MRTLLFLVLVFTLVALGSARKCWTCDDCENETPTKKECKTLTGSTTLDTMVASKINEQAGNIVHMVCKKEVHSDGKIKKNCASQSYCDTKKGLKDSAKGLGIKAREVYCCDGNLCNSAVGFRSGVSGFLLAPAIAILLT